MKRLRFYATIAVLGTGIAMVMQYFDPASPAPPERFVAGEGNRSGSMTEVSPAKAPLPAAKQDIPPPKTVVAPAGPLFRAAKTSGPIGTSEPPQTVLPVRHEAPVAAAQPLKSTHPGEPEASARPTIGGAPGPAAISEDMADGAPEAAAAAAAPVVRAKPRQQRAQAKPAARTKRVESLFLNPLGVR